MYSKNKILVVLKNKLISIDSIIPVLLELKSHLPQGVMIYIVFIDQTHFNEVRRNHHIIKILSQMNAELLIPARRTRLYMIFLQAKLLLSLAFSNVLILKSGNCLYLHSYFVRILKLLSNTIEMQFELLPPIPDFIENMAEDNKLWNTSSDSSGRVNLNFDSDYLLSSLNYDLFSLLYSDHIPDNKFIDIGYVRSYPNWLSFVSKEASLIKDRLNGRYCLYILSTLDKRITTLDEPPFADLLIETLEVLKTFSPSLKLVFKPHFITDMARFKSILKELNIENYSIEYGHPSVLAYGSDFVIGNFFSTTMIDAKALGIPVIEYSSYDRRLLCRLKNNSIGGQSCDYFICNRDKSRLHDIIAKVLPGKPIKMKAACCFSSKISNLFDKLSDFQSIEQRKFLRPGA
jgi:hypothetical protein